MNEKEKIIQSVLNELNEAFNSINGPTVGKEDIVNINLEKKEICIKFDINEVKEDNYIGICFY